MHFMLAFEMSTIMSLADRWSGQFTTDEEWWCQVGRQAGVRTIGFSEHGRPLLGAIIGYGSRHATLIGGSHADEPVGPETLRLLIAAASRREPAMEVVLRRWRLWVVPHVNPDGEQSNQIWIKQWPLVEAFLSHSMREPPGRDLEFGFPAMRPENAAVTAFLASAAPISLHMSLHGMAFSEGVTLLIERKWATRTIALRNAFSRTVTLCGMNLQDEDRCGEKGFHYLGPGFASTPTGAAMRLHFQSAGNDQTACLFHDSSMEQAARSASGASAPLCLVTEVPLFRVSGGEEGASNLRQRLSLLMLRSQKGVAIKDDLVRFGVQPVDPRLAIQLQLRAIELGLSATDPGLL